MKILADASLPRLNEAFPYPFEVTLFSTRHALIQGLASADILLCRSTLKVDKTLIQNYPLAYVATASSGIDHIDNHYLQANKIHLFHAKGSNALAVADYVLACLAYLELKKGIKPQHAGIIGLGCVGSEVSKRLKLRGLKLSHYDPPKALLDLKFQSDELEEVLDAELICLHANLHEHPPFPSRGLLGEKELARLKAKTILINASRGDIIEEPALMALKPDVFYCSDVFSHEPKLDEKVIEFATLVTPHIAGHSLEAKQRAVYMLSEQLHLAYGLKPPIYACFMQKGPKLNLKSTPNHILAWYDPAIESKALKAAPSKADAFLELRKAHHRHEVNWQGF